MKRHSLIPLLVLLLALTTGITHADEVPSLAVAADGPVSLDFSNPAPARDLWSAISRAHSFNVVFAPDLKHVDIAMKIDAETVAEALDRLALHARHMWLPLDSNTIIVASDTPQSHRKYTPQLVRSFRLENLAMKDAMTTLRSIYGLKHITADSQRQTLTVRDVYSRLHLTEKLLDHLDVPPDEVAVGVELVAIPADKDSPNPAELESWKRSGKVDKLLTSRLNVVGEQKASLSLKDRMPTTHDLLSFELELKARVHPSDEAVTLSVSSRVTQLTKADEAAVHGGEKSPESQHTESSWRVTSGKPLIIELPGKLNHTDQRLALVLEPVIRQARSQSLDFALHVGPESHLVPASPSHKSAPGTQKANASADPEREEIRRRLRARLAAQKQGENG